jgi:hypothetical protein
VKTRKDKKMKTNILTRIKNLFSLAANNTSEHEAGQALQKARQLMTEHKLTEFDLRDVTEQDERSGREFGMLKVPDYISILAAKIAELFEVNVWWMSCRNVNEARTRYIYKCQPVFVGNEVKIEIAAYTFEVLSRNLEKGRKNYEPTPSNLYYPWQIKRARTQAKNAYAKGWVNSVSEKIKDMVPEILASKPDPITGVVPLSPYEVYCLDKGLVSSSRRRTRASGKDAFEAGAQAGRATNLNKGMGSHPSKRIG